MTRLEVGREFGEPLGFFLRRTKRLEELAALPGVRSLLRQAVEDLDRWCDAHEVRPQDVEAAPEFFERGLRFCPFKFEP